MILGSAAGVVAIAKPPGLATQAPAGLPSVEEWLRSRLPPGSYVGVPHRLDRAVSGVLLMAVTPRAARQLSRQFERRRIAKTYLALVTADAALAVDETCEWRDFLSKVVGEPRGRLAEAGEPGAREAVTGVRVVARPGAGRLLLELTPVTGRMHQLRIQAAARRMPILGDVAYGSAEPFVPQAPSGGDGARPIALHARCIAYTDPDTGLTVRIEAPLPAWWPAEARAAVGACGS